MSATAISSFTTLIHALAKEAGFPEAEASADETFRMELDGLPLSISRFGTSALVYTSLGTLPKALEKAEQMKSLFLSANVLGRGSLGATLGVMQETGAVTQALRVPLQGMHEGGFIKVIEQFVRAAQEWVALLDAAATSDQSASSAPHTAPGWTAV